MENQLTLAQISDRLNHLQEEIQKFFNTINSGDAINLRRDAYFGKRNINVFVRLDEFSLTKLKETLPKLEGLFKSYSDLRKLESEELDRVSIARQIRQDIDPGRGLF